MSISDLPPGLAAAATRYTYKHGLPQHDFTLPQWGPRGERICRWCAGDGLDAFLPARIRQFLTCQPYIVVATRPITKITVGGTEVRYGGRDGLAADQRPVALGEISERFPYDDWLAHVAAELSGRQDVVYTPFDLIGRSAYWLRCKRCRGLGRR